MVLVETNGSSSADLCQAQLSAEMAAVVEQARAIAQSAAEFFGLPLEQLLSRTYALSIERGPLGFYTSRAQTVSGSGRILTTLHLGVFADWAGGPINAGVFAHELGHVVAEDYGNAALPAVYHELSGTALMTEMVADLIAIHATGSIVSPEEGVPACIQEFRVVRPGLSYDQPVDVFTPLASWKLMTACCQSLSARAAHTSRSRAFCGEYLRERSKPPARMFGSQRFNAEFYAKNPGYADPHELGLPFNSFLLTLRKETGLDLTRALLEAITRTSAAPELPYACVVPALAEFLPGSRQTAHTMAQVLESLRAGLPAEAQGAFDRLSREHRLDIWSQVSELDSAGIAAGKAMQAGAEEYNALSHRELASRAPNAKLRATACWSRGGLSDEEPGCTYACRAEAR